MLQYLKNKKQSEKTMSIFGLLFWILNFTFLLLSLNMLVKIVFAGKSDWFEKAAEKEALKDAFFLNRADLIMTTIVIILTAVICFAIITVLLFRNLQLKNMLTQIGVYRVAGYSAGKILTIAMADIVADVVIAYPVALVLTTISWAVIKNNPLVSALLDTMNNQWWMDVLAYFVCLVIMLAVVTAYTMAFIRKSIKKGVRYMLGKGIV